MQRTIRRVSVFVLFETFLYSVYATWSQNSWTGIVFLRSLAFTNFQKFPYKHRGYQKVFGLSFNQKNSIYEKGFHQSFAWCLIFYWKTIWYMQGVSQGFSDISNFKGGIMRIFAKQIFFKNFNWKLSFSICTFVWMPFGIF